MAVVKLNFLLLLLLLNSCATVAARLDGEIEAPWVYPATRLNYAQLEGTSSRQWGCNCYYWVDLPLSVVGDTLLSPFDLLRGLVTDLANPLCEIDRAKDSDSAASSSCKASSPLVERDL